MKYKFDYERVEYTRGDKILDWVLFGLTVATAVACVKLIGLG